MVEQITIANLPAREKIAILDAKKQIGIILSALDVLKENNKTIDEALADFGAVYLALGGKVDDTKQGNIITQKAKQFLPSIFGKK